MVGVAETLYDTSAQSILPQVVHRDQLSRANGRLYAVELTANQFVGPPLGGLLVAIGVVAGFAAPAALWLAAVGALFLVPGTFRTEREVKTTLRFDIGEGLRFLWNQKILRTLAVMTGVFNFASNAAFAVFVLFAVGPASEMKLSEVGFGLLLTTSALGAFVGSFIAERVEARLGRSKSLALTIFGGALFVGAPALTDNPYILGPLFFVGGVLIVLWNVITVSLRQRIAPNRLAGPGQQRLPPAGLGHHAARCSSGRPAGPMAGPAGHVRHHGGADPRAPRDDAHPHGQSDCRGRRRILSCAAWHGPFGRRISGLTGSFLVRAFKA